MNDLATFFRESRVARFFIPAGIFLIIFSILLFVIDNQNKNYIKTEAVVSKIKLAEEEHTDSEGNHLEATYTVFVKYTVEGKEYEEELGILSGYKEGDKVIITYNPSDPSQISQPSSIILAIGVLLAGIASLVGGIISAIRAVQKHKAMKTQEEGWKNGK